MPTLMDLMALDSSRICTKTTTFIVRDIVETKSRTGTRLNLTCWALNITGINATTDHLKAGWNIIVVATSRINKQ